MGVGAEVEVVGECEDVRLCPRVQARIPQSHTRTHINVHVIRFYTCMYVVFTCTCGCVFVRVYICSHVYTYIYMYVCACVCACI